MTRPFKKGDRVQLTNRYADALNRSFHATLDWRSRRGSVTRCNLNDVTIRWDGRGIKTYIMRDSPLDRAHKKGIISGAEHSALQKYRHHWYHAGQAPTISSLDLDRIFSGGDGGPAGMPKSEGQVFHRQRWREAQQCLGMRSSAIVDRFVCREENLELCGQLIGWANKPQAIAGAAELVKDAGYRLAKLWGIG